MRLRAQQELEEIALLRGRHSQVEESEDNYLAVQEALGLGRNDLCRLARNAWEARFLAPGEKEKLIGELDDYAGRG